MRRKYIASAFLFSLIVTSSTLRAQEGVADPKQVKFITTDITNFWKMYDKLPKATSEKDTLQIIKTLYLDRASATLQEYFADERRENKRNITQEYLSMLREYPNYLASIRRNTESIDKEKLYEHLVRAKELYPDFKFRDTYFCIGFFNSGGRSMASGGLYIGTEMFALSDDTAMEEWKGSTWVQFFAPIEDIHNIVLHEQAHFQQLPPTNGERNLLYDAIREGAAVFLVDIVTNGEGITQGGGIGKSALIYGDAHEEEVWHKFEKDMRGYDQSVWFYNAETEEWPKDMGYYVGYKICRSYYDNAKDKALAVKEILEVTDAEEFLDKSGYGNRFQ